MRAASRAYADAVRWVRASRRNKVDPASFGRAAFLHAMVLGILLMSVAGLVSPKSFGSPGSRALGSGWVTAWMVGLIAAAGLHFAARYRAIRRGIELLRLTLSGSVAEEGYEGATNALASCPAPLRSRFAFSWVWLPLFGAALGFLLACSSAYFIVDAVIARFDVGLGQVLYGIASATASLMVFLLSAPRLISWRVAYAANRDARDQ